jgi:hypothetical protein
MPGACRAALRAELRVLGGLGGGSAPCCALRGCTASLKVWTRRPGLGVPWDEQLPAPLHASAQPRSSLSVVLSLRGGAPRQHLDRGVWSTSPGRRAALADLRPTPAVLRVRFVSAAGSCLVVAALEPPR